MKACYDCGQPFPDDLEHFAKTHGEIGGQCLGCRKKYMKDYYEKNKIKWQAYAAKRDPEENQRRVREWQKKYPDRARQNQLAWHRAHPEGRLERARKHREDNPEVYRCYVRNRRALLKNVPGRHTEKDIAAQLASQDGLCFYCKKDLNGTYHTDHFIPVSKRGSNGPENIVIACSSCNLRKNAKMPEVFMAELEQACSV